MRIQPFKLNSLLYWIISYQICTVSPFIVTFVPGVTWLDIFSDLLTDNEENLKPQYDLDDTHLNPSYVALLETAFQKHYETMK